MMRLLPHWLRHHWSEWKPADRGGSQFLGPSLIDRRTCSHCNRRQERYIR